MRISILTAVGCLLLALAPARAEKLDLSTMTCKQFMSIGKDEMGIILTWLGGNCGRLTLYPGLPGLA